jgi:H+/Cl- antiporter ClcA
MDYESIVVVVLLVFLSHEPRFSIMIIAPVFLIIFIINVIFPRITKDGMEGQTQESKKQSQSITFYLLFILLVVLFLKRYL